jgi:membrane associated rhomboid family serine protease
LNVVFYVGTVFIADDLFEEMALYFFKHPEFHFWQPLTHMFLHSPGSILHIALNMYGLFLFGPPLENWMGSNRFLFFYMASGLGAYLLTTGIDFFQYEQGIRMLTQEGYTIDEAKQIFDEALDVGIAKDQIIGFHTPMVGASGAIFGVLAGFALLYPNVELRLLFPPIPIKAKWLIGIYVAYETLSALGIFNFQTNVGHAAHLGGAIFGGIMVWYWKRHQFDGKRWQ